MEAFNVSVCRRGQKRAAGLWRLASWMMWQLPESTGNVCFYVLEYYGLFL